MRSDDRTFSVIRLHNGVAEILPDLDDDPNTITIETDRFSTYAIVYQESAKSPDTGNNVKFVSFIFLIMAVIIASISYKRKHVVAFTAVQQRNCGDV